MSSALTYLPEKIGEFQNAIDRAVDLHGVEGATSLLKLLSYVGGQKSRKSYPYGKLISGFIIAEICSFFEVTEEELFTHKKDPGFRMIRMICYSLLKDYARMSQQSIAQLFKNVNRKQVSYYCGICESRLSVPHIHKDFNYNYRKIQARVLLFVQKVKTDG